MATHSHFPDTKHCGCSQADGSPPNPQQGSSLYGLSLRGLFLAGALLLMGRVTSISLHAFAEFCTSGG